MKEKLFRKAALDRLMSPEKLHTLMRVTDAKAWIALVAAGLLIATAAVWGVLGRIPTKLEASGLLVHSGGLADVVSIGSGQVIALEVDVGDYVKEGQTIARIAQPELKEQIAGLEKRLRELKSNYQRSQAAGGQDLGLRLKVSAEARKNMQSAMLASQARSAELQDRLGKQERLLEKGLITGERVEATREALRSVKLSMETLRAEEGRLDVENFSAQRANQSALMGARMELQDTEQNIKLLRERLESDSQVVSTHDGRVVEVRINVGDLLVPGTPLISLERLGKAGRLEALLYVDSREGKLLQEGMEVQIAPTIVRKERDGVLLAKVKSVESFPSSRQGMMRLLHNEQLVTTLLQETSGAPLAVKAQLTVDKGTPSGYRWSSGNGPDLVLTSGTRCAAFVTTKSERPLALVFPTLDLGNMWR